MPFMRIEIPSDYLKLKNIIYVTKLCSFILNLMVNKITAAFV
jgi:hypothetical protein